MTRTIRLLLITAVLTWASMLSAQTAPVISAVAVSGITPTSATVTWTTDVASDSMVFRSIVQDDYISFGFKTAVTDAGGVTSHSVTLTGLEPGTGYWYGLRSRNVADLTKLTAWEDAESTNSFTTSAAPTSGTLDFTASLYGPHHVMQGYPIIVNTEGALLAGTASYTSNTWKIVLTGIPPNTSIHWLTPELVGQCNQSATTVTNDTVVCSSPGINPFELLTTGSTTVGTYTVTATISVNGGTATHAYTWSVTVDAPTALTPGTPSSYPAIPSLATWQSYMTTYGATWCLQTGAPYDQDVWYYDGLSVFQQIRAYTNDSATWTPCINSQISDYRDGYVIPNTGAIPLIKQFPQGIYNDYSLYGGTGISKTGVLNLASHAGMGVAGFGTLTYLREQSYALTEWRLANKLGGSYSAWIDAGVANLVGYAEVIGNGTATSYSPFMAGLMAEALIRYYEDGHQSDARIPWAIKQLCDYIYANAYNKLPSQPGALYYNSFRYSVGLTDESGINFGEWRGLNPLIAPMYAWLFKYTGSSTYQTQGDAIWAGTYLANPADTVGYSGKNFSQEYRWSFNYVNWRSTVNTGAVTLTPVSYLFSNTLVGQSLTASFVLANKTSANITLTSQTVTGTSFSLVAGSSTCVAGMVLSPTAQCNFTVQFTPASATTFSGSLTAVLSSGTLNSSLTGTGYTVVLAPRKSKGGKGHGYSARG